MKGTVIAVGALHRFLPSVQVVAGRISNKMAVLFLNK